MHCALVLVAAFGVLVSFRAAAAQVESPQAREIRLHLEALQHRLADLTRNDPGGRNVTEIGSSRGRSLQDDQPRLVVRIYDLSDLFSIAPRYAAHEPTDLQAIGRAIFPDAARSASSRARRTSKRAFERSTHEPTAQRRDDRHHYQLADREWENGLVLGLFEQR